APLDELALVEAIRVAFASRAQPLTDVRDVVYNPAWWTTDKARQRWAKFCALTPTAPTDLGAVAARVAAALWPALAALIELPACGPISAPPAPDATPAAPPA